MHTFKCMYIVYLPSGLEVFSTGLETWICSSWIMYSSKEHSTGRMMYVTWHTCDWTNRIQDRNRPNHWLEAMYNVAAIPFSLSTTHTTNSSTLCAYHSLDSRDFEKHLWWLVRSHFLMMATGGRGGIGMCVPLLKHGSLSQRSQPEGTACCEVVYTHYTPHTFTRHPSHHHSSSGTLTLMHSH